MVYAEILTNGRKKKYKITKREKKRENRFRKEQDLERKSTTQEARKESLQKLNV